MNQYANFIGYSPLENVGKEKMRHVIRMCKVIIEMHHPCKQGDQILVAGDGDGTKASFLSEEFLIPTTGVDIIVHPAHSNVQFQLGTILLNEI